MLDVYPAREEPVGELAGVSGLQVAEAAADRAGGRPVWWLRDHERRDRALAARLGDGRRARHPRRGRHLRALRRAARRERERGALTVERMTEPEGIERDYPLARLTTVRAGGNADFFARPEATEALVGLLAWARERGIQVEVVGSGSNLLVADVGFRGLVHEARG